MMIGAAEALERLRAGNRRFAEHMRIRPTATRRMEVAERQEPIAIILGCSDSRVPADTVFDQELGSLFVIRVAGNVVQTSQIGSVEYAATKFGTRLVVVLGHSRCGAIEETIEGLRSAGKQASRNLNSIVELIRPSVEPLLEAGADNAPETIMELAVRANVRASVEQLRRGSGIIENLERNDGLVIVGAEYSLETGVVDFFDGVPE